MRVYTPSIHPSTHLSTHPSMHDIMWLKCVWVVDGMHRVSPPSESLPGRPTVDTKWQMVDWSMGTKPPNPQRRRVRRVRRRVRPGQFCFTEQQAQL